MKVYSKRVHTKNSWVLQAVEMDVFQPFFFVGNAAGNSALLDSEEKLTSKSTV